MSAAPDPAAPGGAPDPAELWAIVDLMGHRRLAGRASEVTAYGATLMRLDVPAGDGFVSKLIGSSAIYEVTVCTEAVARAAAARMADPRPLEPAGFQTRPVLGHRSDPEGDDDVEPL